MKRLLLIVLPLLLIVGCSSPEPINYETTLVDREGVFYTKDTNQPYSGPVFSIDKNGRNKRESILEDGKMITYKYFKYYENGQKMRESFYKDGKEDGLRTELYENGQMKRKVIFKDGKPDGLLTHWYENGQKKGEGSLKDGKPDGLSTNWFENGQKKEEGTYKDGELISKKEWNEDGSVKE